jgi:hypothetical protein
MARIVIERDEEDFLTMTVKDEDGEIYATGVSEKLVSELKAELKSHLGGVCSDQFDPVTSAAIQMLEIENG